MLAGTKTKAAGFDSVESHLLVAEKHLSRADAYILASDAVDLRITQLVDGKKGVHALLATSLSSR